MAKKDRAARLAALREKIENTDTGGSQKGWFSPPVGKSTIRILPEVGEMDFFFQEVGRHYVDSLKKSVYCPNFTSGGDLECPVCELVNDLYRAGDKASKKMASDLRVRKTYWMNIINRDDENAGPQIFTPGVTIFQSIVGYINDPEYGDIIDEDEGTDLIIERTGTGMDTEYQVRAARLPSPLHTDDDVIDKWFDDAKQLTWVELSEDPEEDSDLADGHTIWVLPYDRIIKELDLDSVMDVADEDDDEEEEEEEEVVEEHPVKRRVSQRRARRK